MRMLGVEKGDVSPLNPLGEGLRICRMGDLPTFILPSLHYWIPAGVGMTPMRCPDEAAKALHRVNCRISSQ
jgi:hypothetical protein